MPISDLSGRVKTSVAAKVFSHKLPFVLFVFVFVLFLVRGRFYSQFIGEEKKVVVTEKDSYTKTVETFAPEKKVEGRVALSTPSAPVGSTTERDTTEYRKSYRERATRKMEIEAADEKRHFIISACVSGTLLLAALYVMLSKRYPEETIKWAFATVGTILGYWLKGN